MVKGDAVTAKNTPEYGTGTLISRWSTGDLVDQIIVLSKMICFLEQNFLQKNCPQTRKNKRTVAKPKETLKLKEIKLTYCQQLI